MKIKLKTTKTLCEVERYSCTPFAESQLTTTQTVSIKPSSVRRFGTMAISG